MIAPAFTRSQDWWEPKMAILIGLVLMLCSSCISDVSWENAFFLSQVLLTIFFGAIFVSVINDYFDLDEDILAGKRNRLKGVTPAFRLLLIAVFLFALLILFYSLRIYPLGLGFFIAGIVSYLLYSLPPIRLKSKGFFGVFADAAGAHLFPTLGIVAFLTAHFNIHLDFQTSVLLGIWSFSYGVRCILVHQYMDLEADRIVNLKTLASQIESVSIKKWEKPLVFVEVILFGLLLYKLELFTAGLLLLSYLFYALIIHKFSKFQYTIILQNSTDEHWNILMAFFYQFLLPLFLLVLLSVASTYFLFAIPLFIMAFPNSLISNFHFIRSIYKPTLY